MKLITQTKYRVLVAGFTLLPLPGLGSLVAAICRAQANPLSGSSQRLAINRALFFQGQWWQLIESPGTCTLR